MSPENDRDEIRHAVEWIRARASPGNHGEAFRYAQVVRLAFEEIKALQSEKFRLITICKGFEANGLLPEGANPDNFSRAVRREETRRRKSTEMKRCQSGSCDDTVEMIEDRETPESKNNMAKRKPVRKRATSITPSFVTGSASPAAQRNGVEINPDNTFKIRPIDPDDLPEIK